MIGMRVYVGASSLSPSHSVEIIPTRVQSAEDNHAEFPVNLPDVHLSQILVLRARQRYRIIGSNL